MAKDQAACRKIPKDRLCRWSDNSCSFHEERANLLEAILPYQFLGLISVAGGIAMMLIGPSYRVHFSKIAGVTMIATGLYGLALSYNSYVEARALANEYSQARD